MFPTTTVTGSGTQLHVVHGDDSGLFVRFYFNKVYDKHFVKINIPGDAKTEWDRPVNEIDKQRFAKQWQLYESQQNQYGTQTMLKDAEWITEQQMAHLNAHNVHTVEQLSMLTDSMITACGIGTRDLVRKAQGFLTELTSRRESEAAIKELEKRDYQIETQNEQIKALQDQMAQLLAANANTKSETLHVPKKASSA